MARKSKAAIQRSEDDKIIEEAQKRFRLCEKWESDARNLFLDDIKFCNADSDNGYQWPNDIRRNRDVDERPCLTVNKTRQHCLQIINDAKQNKPSVAVKAVGNGATYESAQIFEGVIRHIEYISNAQSAYDMATKFQVQGGVGYWRIATDYCGDDSFDQEIFVRPVKDPLTIFLDPDIQEADGSDARFGFVFDDMPRDEFEDVYGEYKDYVGKSALGNTEGWLDEDHVRVAEYFRKVEKKDKLVAMNVNGEQVIVKASSVPKEIMDQVIDSPDAKIREIIENEVEWFLIIGDHVAKRSIWPGKYIPIVRVIGEETIIDGQLDRKGHTRAMKDPQRIYNYWTSSSVENVALQSKTPFIGPMNAFSGLETYWDQANRVNFSWLPYNAYDDKGQLLPPPQRQSPPVMSQAYMTGMQIASDELRAVSGQYQAEMGMPSNETSGIAIQQRQRQGDNATYHFIDNLALAIRFTGKILIDLIPKIYDTKRIIKIMAEDGVETEVMIDPGLKQSYLQKQQMEKEKVQAIFNPNVGKYEVEADIGPAYATRRQEAFNAFVEIMKQNPNILQIAGDLVFKAADFPMADELAERYRRTMPPGLLGEAPPPQIESMQQQLQNMQGLIKQLTQAYAEEKSKNKDKSDKSSIDAYRAETDRLEVFASHNVDMKNFALNVAQLVKEMLTEGAPQASEGAGGGQSNQPAAVNPQMAQAIGALPMSAPDMMAA